MNFITACVSGRHGKEKILNVLTKLVVMNAFFFLQTSDSVTLDLLTYADLELLRNRKAGVVSRPRSHQQPSALTAKRYLILIYTVEFDRCVPTFSLLLNIILFGSALRCT